MGVAIAALLCLPASAAPAEEQTFPLDAERILFLGDSITHNGRYVAWIETQLRLEGVEPLPEIINIGLSSETASGLSERNHPFPRPDVHERLDRAVAKIKPDVVVACYGMNDGIYHPLSEARFKAYRDGINRLVEKCQAAGAKVILLTPPPYDPVPVRDKKKLQPAGAKEYSYQKTYEGYDDVLAHYSEWIKDQKDRVAMVIDIRTPLVERVQAKRESDPKYTVSPDGVHPNVIGHQLMGNTILKAWGIEPVAEPDAELFKLVHRRLSILHDAWLKDVGHKHPGVKGGLLLDEAKAKAGELEEEIEALTPAPASVR